MGDHRGTELMIGTDYVECTMDGLQFGFPDGEGKEELMKTARRLGDRTEQHCEQNEDGDWYSVV